jgi:signal transduction histidine kinase
MGLDTGIAPLGDVAWGTHFCHFYRSGGDLAETLVPFFARGLAANEKCLWVTSSPLAAADARGALAGAVPDLRAREARGQIEIIDHDSWYRRGGATDADSVLHGWIDREQQALRDGFAGLRLTGNTAWLERAGWDDFMEYESRVTGTFAGRRVVGLCSYPLERCGPQDVLDVVRHHQFALARREGAWELLESTDLKTAKATLARENERLERRVAERTAALEAALRDRDQFISMASHELRTPIAALRLALDGLVRGRRRGELTPEDEERKLRRAMVQAERLTRLVSDLLDLTRARLGRLDMSPSDEDLAALIVEVGERMAEPLAATGNTLAVRAGAPVPARVDRIRIEQVLTNLLANAARHAPGTPVELRAEATPEGGARLVVRDRGPGVALRERERIFEAFTQTAAAHGAGGFGLGLWIVRLIVEGHGGTVHVQDEGDGGATFVVELPPAAPRLPDLH